MPAQYMKAIFKAQLRSFSAASNSIKSSLPLSRATSAGNSNMPAPCVRSSRGTRWTTRWPPFPGERQATVILEFWAPKSTPRELAEEISGGPIARTDPRLTPPPWRAVPNLILLSQLPSQTTVFCGVQTAGLEAERWQCRACALGSIGVFLARRLDPNGAESFAGATNVMFFFRPGTSTRHLLPVVFASCSPLLITF